MAKKILVTYATKHGATAEIAEKIGAVLKETGLKTDVKPIKDISDPSSYNAVVLGSALYIGRWHKAAAKFLKENENALADKPVWIFSSGPTGEGNAGELMEGWNIQKKLRPIVDRINPRGRTVFHGTLDSAKLSFFEKWITKRVKAPMGDFREWEAITSWAADIAASLKEKDS